MKSELARFVVVGTLGFVVDGGGTWLLTSLGVSPLVARVPAIAAAMTTTWLLNRSVTFRVDKPRSAAEFSRYLAVALSSAFLNYLLYTALVLAGVVPVIAVALATIALLLGSFLAYRRVVFR